MNRYYIITGQFNGVDTYFDGKSWSIYKPQKFKTFLEKGKALNKERLEKGLKAKGFFMSLLTAPINRICVENPLPSRIYNFPLYSQIVQPFEHGHPFQKKTLLWLKNLPPIIPTKIIEEYQSTRNAGNWFNKGGNERQCNRSKTFQGIADAMAKQWG